MVLLFPAIMLCNGASMKRILTLSAGTVYSVSGYVTAFAIWKHILIPPGPSSWLRT